MRIALLTSAKGWRGSGASYAKLAQGLAARGHVAQLVTTAPRLTEAFRREHLAVTEIPARNTGGREIIALLRTLRELAVDLVVADTPRDLRLAAWATLLHAAPLVYRYNLNYRRPRQHLGDRLYGRRVSACVFQSQYIEEHALLHEPWTARVRRYQIPNGYDTVRFAPRPAAAIAFRERWQIPASTKVVVTASKLEQGKGHDVALAALWRLGLGDELVYVICGDGTRDGELRALASDYQLPVRFTGMLDIDSIVAALTAADLVIQPSVREIFPNAVGEAMSCMRAVVAADAGGTAELLGRDGSTGLLVPPNDVVALSKAIRDLLGDPSRRGRMGAAARRRVETAFSIDRMIDSYEAALREVIGRE
jgi:glycosyltransferase involved in cell wall biosynthesis